MNDVVEVPTLNKRKLTALERLFAAEIEDRLPLQSTASVFLELEKEGLVEQGERKFGRDRFGPIVCRGWFLTHAGRLTYCMHC